MPVCFYIPRPVQKNPTLICIRDIDYNMPTECYENFGYVLLAISCIRFCCRSDTAPDRPGYRRISICGQTSGTRKRDLQGSPSTLKHWHQIFTCCCSYLTERDCNCRKKPTNTFWVKIWFAKDMHHILVGIICHQEYKTNQKSDQILWTKIYTFWSTEGWSETPFAH